MSEENNDKIRVLLVDDEAAITETLGLNLKASGRFIVKALNDSNQAPAVAADFDPDILLLDIVMPGLDGGDVLRRIRALPGLENVPALMVTALVSNNEADEHGLVHCGDSVMVPKPVQFPKLLEAMDALLAAAP